MMGDQRNPIAAWRIDSKVGGEERELISYNGNPKQNLYKPKLLSQATRNSKLVYILLIPSTLVYHV